MRKAACYWILLESITYLMEAKGRALGRTQEWNAICLDIGEKIGRRRDAIRLLKELLEAVPVSYEQISASVRP